MQIGNNICPTQIMRNNADISWLKLCLEDACDFWTAVSLANFKPCFLEAVSQTKATTLKMTEMAEQSKHWTEQCRKWKVNAADVSPPPGLGAQSPTPTLPI